MITTASSPKPTSKDIEKGYGELVDEVQWFGKIIIKNIIIMINNELERSVKSFCSSLSIKVKMSQIMLINSKLMPSKIQISMKILSFIALKSYFIPQPIFNYIVALYDCLCFLDVHFIACLYQLFSHFVILIQS